MYIINKALSERGRVFFFILLIQGPLSLFSSGFTFLKERDALPVTHQADLPVPTLVLPTDGQKLAFDRNESSFFLWEIDSGKYPAGEYLCDFLLVAVNPGQKPEDAIEKNPAYYSRKEIETYYLSYPWDAPDLGEGNYAWRITLYKKILPSVKVHSKVLPFVIAQDGETWHEKVDLTRYNQSTELKEKLDASYQMAYDKKLYFKYEELYELPEGQMLRFRIFDAARNLVVYTDESGTIFPSGAAPPVSMATGTNYLLLNLESASGIAMEKFYTLEVWNAKNEYWYLRFLTGYSDPVFGFSTTN